MEKKRQHHGPHIKNRERALEFYRYFLDHPEYFSEDGVMPDAVIRDVEILETQFSDIPEDVQPAEAPFLSQVEIVIPIEDAVKMLESMGCSVVFGENEKESHRYVFGEWCILKDPAGNMFMIVQR